jgi:hypothetical protein
MYCSEKERLLMVHAKAGDRWLAAASALLNKMDSLPKNPDDPVRIRVLDARQELRLAKLSAGRHQQQHQC